MLLEELKRDTPEFGGCGRTDSQQCVSTDEFFRFC